MLYDMGHGVYDLMYHGYIQEQTKNAKLVYEQLKDSSKQMTDILEKAIYHRLDRGWSIKDTLTTPQSNH